MADTLSHRGPDSRGSWADASVGIALGHRRLAIIDLSEEGHQPMHSATGRYVVTYNGEIYNFRDLRQELGRAGWSFRGHSDTEVLLAAVEAWGLPRALRRFVGMFAFGLWDRQTRTLHLCRDRLGEKPLYYGWVSGALVFGSELRALRQVPGWTGEIDRISLARYLQHGNVPAPFSIHEGIRKVPPGATVTCGEETVPREWPEPERYWSFREVAAAGLRDPLQIGEEEAIGELDRLLSESIAGQMVADVPLGAFLSGGIDSSAVVASMQAQSASPIRTFSIGFHHPTYDEAPHARAVAAHLGTSHTELYVSGEDALAIVPALPEIYDEPFADSSQIPTYLISRLARSRVTVSLSGDGGDELFGGYDRYLAADRIWRVLSRVPAPLRGLGAAAIGSVPAGALHRVGSGIGGLLPRRWRTHGLPNRLKKLSEVLRVERMEDLYARMLSEWTDPCGVVLGSSVPEGSLAGFAEQSNFATNLDWMMYSDAVGYLPDTILVKVDRAAMACSLETRVPLLDHRIVEFAWKLPLAMRVRGGEGKWLLRRLLERYVPRELTDRPKMGFGVPIDSWLVGPLRDWAEALLDERRLTQEGFFRPETIRSRWREHVAGERSWHYALWPVLMFQAWSEQTSSSTAVRNSDAVRAGTGAGIGF